MKNSISNNTAPRFSRSLRWDFVRVGVTAVAYFLAYQISFSFPDSGQVLMAVWPAAGIGLAALLLSPRYLWPAIIATFVVVGNAANIFAGRPLVDSVGGMSANVLESLGSAWLITAWCGLDIRFTRTKEIVALLCAATIVNALSAAIGAGFAASAHNAPFWRSWATWWASDGLGILLIAPFIVTWSTRGVSLVPTRWSRVFEAGLFFGLWCYFAWIIFTANTTAFNDPLDLQPYMVFALVAWGAFRFEQRGVTLALVILAGIAATGSAVSMGSFHWGGITIADRLLHVQLYLGLVSITGYLLAASYDESKQAAGALLESEEKHRTIIRTAMDGFWVVDMQGRLREVNDTYCRMSGYSVQELLGMRIPDLESAESADEIAAHIQKIMAQGEDRYESRHRRKDGSVFDVAISVKYQTAEGGCLVAFLQDISERKRAEEQLHKLSLAVEQSPASIVITDTHGDIEYVNPKFTQVTGYTLEEALGRNSRILKSGETPAKEYETLWETITAGREWQGEFHNIKKNGEMFWERASISPVKNEEDVVTNFVAVKEDITELKRAEYALRLAQKLESIGTLAGGIAHDFNNLLHAMLGQLSLALGKLSPESPAKNHIEKTIKSVERAADLTQQLLAYSGKGKFLVEEVDLNRLIHRNVQMLETSVPRSALLQLDLGSPSPRIRGDAGQIQQVVMNLIINAGEAMGSKSGYITLRTGRIELTEHDTEYWKYTGTPLVPGTYALLQVNDTGGGMKPEQLERIFDPFYTTKFTGRGLGLAAVLGIVRGHHGGIRIQSQEGQEGKEGEEGKGTKFETIFPIAESVVEPEPGKAQPSAVIDGNGKTVLVIDDEPAVLELLTDIFTDANFEVLGALNPVEGIELYRQHQREIAVVILDYSMPGMDGKAAFEELLKINKEVKVLVCSGYTEEEMQSAFAGVRPGGFIHKPYRPATILERVSSMISGARPE